ncbi:MAG: Porphobilinogen deaminase [Desulfovibrio sp.]
MNTLTIATRGSKLALWQAEYVKSRILETAPQIEEISLLVLKTKGDNILDVPLAKIGGKGLFVKEIEEALLDGRADLAVHSMKDVPMILPEHLTLGAIMEREDARDMFLSTRHATLADLPPGAKIGTSSLRRSAQLLRARQDITIIPLRGNVDTRLAKLAAGEFDAIIMAAAGVKRLSLTAPYMHAIDAATMLPAAGQGALGLEYREDRPEIANIAAPLDHDQTRLCVSAERAFLTGLDGGCQTPIGAHAVTKDGLLTLTGLLCDLKGSRMLTDTASMDAALGTKTAKGLGLGLADKIKQSGGDALLRELFAASESM